MRGPQWEARMSVSSLSYVSGISDEPLLYKTIDAVLREAAANWGERDALIVVQQGIRWSWRELDREVGRVAAGLLRLGLQPGDRVGIWSPNRAKWGVTHFAAARAVRSLVIITPAYLLS